MGCKWAPVYALGSRTQGIQARLGWSGSARWSCPLVPHWMRKGMVQMSLLLCPHNLTGTDFSRAC